MLPDSTATNIISDIMSTIPTDLATTFTATLPDSTNVLNDLATVMDANVWQTILITVLIVFVAIGITILIFKFSRRFELYLEKLTERENLVIPKTKINLKNLLALFIFFYTGVKLIVIMAIITWGVSFVLQTVHLDDAHHFRHALFGIFNALSLSIISYYVYRLLNLVYKKTYRRINTSKNTLLGHLKSKSLSLIFEDKLIDILKLLFRLVYYAILIFAAYIYMTLLFSFFSFSRTWSGLLFGYITSPIKSAFSALIGYLPNLFAVIVIFFIIKYLLKLIQMVFSAIEREVIVVPNFYKDWAMPTFKIVRFLIIVFGAIVIFPYLPGSNSPFFQGISIFVGVLFSLGSTSAISNIVAGVVLTYMRPFKEGDVVKISDTLGKVIEKTLLVTRIRTIKNVDITVPNSMVLSSHIVNYSSSSQDSHLILHTNFSMGYTVPWRQVHELLIKAALMTEDILPEPAPFVLQKALDDYYTSYELNAYTSCPQKMMATYSEMHKNIQDVFIEAGIDLVAPHFVNVERRE